jgi:hypothetical protein
MREDIVAPLLFNQERRASEDVEKSLLLVKSAIFESVRGFL